MWKNVTLEEWVLPQDRTELVLPKKHDPNDHERREKQKKTVPESVISTIWPQPFTAGCICVYMVCGVRISIRQIYRYTYIRVCMRVLRLCRFALITASGTADVDVQHSSPILPRESLPVLFDRIAKYSYHSLLPSFVFHSSTIPFVNGSSAAWKSVRKRKFFRYRILVMLNSCTVDLSLIRYGRLQWDARHPVTCGTASL